MQLIVAEKPSVARDLARVLGVRPAGKHWFEGDRRVITWCVGHLVELDEPAAYDARWKAWRLDTLPMVPREFRLRPARHAADQLRAVVRLLSDRRFTSVVNACDAGREGELIFRYLVQFAGKSPPVQRLWISSLTDEAIRKGFAALRPAGQLDSLADAARSRSEADWLVGMNATRAITAHGRAAGHTSLSSIGRVQTPTLAMLVRREQAIRAFVPRPYWEIRGEFTTSAGQRFTAGWRHDGAARVATAALAEAIVARDAAHGAAADPVGPRVERLRARTVREPPPLLFDLTALQRTANRRFGLSAARTLEIAQALYERHKILTYPRTDSRHLSSDLVGELPAVFAALAEVPGYAAFAAPLAERPPRPGRRVVDDAKVHDHHAIIPTATPVPLAALDRDERRLFDLVARRFLAAFYPDAEFAVTEAWIRVGPARPGDPGPPLPPADPVAARSPAAAAPDEPPLLERLPPEPDRYLARGRVRIAAGWQEVSGIDPSAAPSAAPAAAAQDQGPDAEPAASLPALAEGEPLDGRFSPIARHTTPPPRYTEATLLGAMESAGKAIDDEALRLAMRDTGLGTPATRASIIETLLRRDYVVRTRQQLAPTELGIALIEALPVKSLASPELTGAWEARLARIARGQDSRAAFMADIARYVAEIVDAIRSSPPPAVPLGPSGSAGAAAPTGPAASFGARRPARARRSNPGSQRPQRSHGPLRPQRSRSGAVDRSPRPGAGALDRPRSPRTSKPRPRAGALDGPRSHHTSPPVPSALDRTVDRARRPGPPPAIGELSCPRCHAGAVIAGSRGWGCSRWRDGCHFVVWFETAGRRLSAAQLRDLVIRGKTRKARFRTDRGEDLDGRLVLDLTAEGGSALLVPA
ncbi:MAG TPA: DNA topoisomerase [Kofleriaceae bacterium]|nr:DNA topoisomerase [Kofleriaceae bacterium]